MLERVEQSMNDTMILKFKCGRTIQVPVHTIRQIVGFQSMYRFKRKLYQKLNNETERYGQILFHMMEQLHQNYIHHVRQQSVFNEQMENLEKIVTEYLKLNADIVLQNNLTITFRIYNMFMKRLSDIQHHIKTSMHAQGTKQISNILFVELQFELNSLSNKQLYGWWLHFLNQTFIPLNYDIYMIDMNSKLHHISNNISTTASLITPTNQSSSSSSSHPTNQNQGKRVKTFQISGLGHQPIPTASMGNDIITINSLIEKQFILPECFPLSITNEMSLTECLHGAKCFIPIPSHFVHYCNTNIKTYVVVCSGYFKNDAFHISRYNKYLYEKYNNLSYILNTSNHQSFNKSWIAQLSLRDVIVHDTSTLSVMCSKAYQKYQSLASKTVANLVKDFLQGTLYFQREVLTYFLMMEEDNQSQCLAYLMYDMISQESYLLKPQPLAEQIYNNLHWTIQKKFRTVYENMNKAKNNTKFNEENINYESRIFLLKCDESVKKKAFDKYKEIQNKSNENSIKAQQYLDGLLRIPFKYYKKEYIFSFLSNFRERFIDYCNQYSSLGSYADLYALHHYLANQKNITAHQLENYIEQLCDGYKTVVIKEDVNWNSEIVRDYFLMFSISQIHQLVGQFKKKLGVKYLEYLNGEGKKLKVKTNYKKNGETFKYETEEVVTALMEWIEYIRLNNKQIWKIVLQELPIRNRSESFNQMLQYEYQFKCLQKEWITYKSSRQDYLKEVRKTLEESVYGHQDAKRHIEHIIAQWIHGETTGYCFGFEGPPGTGKTSMAKLGLSNCFRDEEGNSRPFAFIALGGSSNGSTFEGHSYTYVGSTWGRIVDILMETKCMNPIIYIDELDKVSQTEHGREIVGILTHITDPTQNDEFVDKYFAGVKLDLSKVLFIFSYNDPDKIDPILRDRIHRIKFHPLKRKEKKEICKLHILPVITKAVGLTTEDVLFEDETLDFIIDNYTLEGGARKLKERIFEIVCELNLRHLMDTEGYASFPIHVTIGMLKDDIFADKPFIIPKRILTNPRVGIANGMYASTSGIGGITVIECFKIPTTSPMTLELTGQQGDVMKESMSVAKTVAWNLLTNETKTEIAAQWKKEGYFGLHIHCPEGAVPKDGPSAGCIITIAMVSCLLGIPVLNTVAMTGEIDLNGQSRQIGGLETKILGAKEAGVLRVIFPEENQHDLEQILKEEEDNPFDDHFTYKTVQTIWDALEEFFPHCAYPFNRFDTYYENK